MCWPVLLLLHGFGSDALPDTETMAAALGTSTFLYRVDDNGLTIENHGTFALGALLAAFGGLGDDVLSARNVAPTLIVNYHFGSDGDRSRHLGRRRSGPRLLRRQGGPATEEGVDEKEQRPEEEEMYQRILEQAHAFSPVRPRPGRATADRV